MPELQLNTDDPFILTVVEKWLASRDIVENLDEKMNIESFGKTKLLNMRFAEANPEDKPNELAVAVKRYLEDATDDDVFAGLFETVRRTLNSKEFTERLNSYVEKSLPKVDETDKPKDDELKAMREERKKNVDNMNGIRGLLEGTAPDWFEFEGKNILRNAEGKPENYVNLRGAYGERKKTGIRLGATFQFTVFHGDNETILQDRKLSAVKDHLKKDVKSVGELRKAIEDQNNDFDWASPPNKFEFDFAGRHIVANKMTDESSEAEEDEEVDNLVTEVPDDTDTDDSPLLFDDDE